MSLILWNRGGLVNVQHYTSVSEWFGLGKNGSIIGRAVGDKQREETRQKQGREWGEMGRRRT